MSLVFEKPALPPFICASSFTVKLVGSMQNLCNGVFEDIVSKSWWSPGAKVGGVASSRDGSMQEEVGAFGWQQGVQHLHCRLMCACARLVIGLVLATHLLILYFPGLRDLASPPSSSTGQVLATPVPLTCL